MIISLETECNQKMYSSTNNDIEEATLFTYFLTCFIFEDYFRGQKPDEETVRGICDLGRSICEACGGDGEEEG